MIEQCWMSYRDKQMFKLLKHAVCAAEHSLTYEILRKVAPREAEFFKDPSCKIRVRFRFGGYEFPPEIYFKIYSHTDGKGITYISGKRVIKAGTEAARDACDLMGHRKFLDQVIQDTIHHEQFKVTDEIDVTTMKDYMQYLSHLDETPAEMGGRDNTWRKLTLGVLPRTTIFYDLVDYAYSKRLTPRLKREIPHLAARPVTQEVQHEHIRIISRLRSPIQMDVPLPTPKSKSGGSRLSQTSSRRSKQARMKAMKMRKMYGLEKDENTPAPPGTREVTFLTDADDKIDEYDFGGSDEDWEEEEAKELYQWAQKLQYDDVIATPRLPTSNN
ncbi:uncharacterized protein CXorf58-like isoform X2 [Lineus longissimus]|uniref:uncharacterized protein CXorf58-like isoform X2 n=1 Tax=Lineus longissimus TaxID=88925 RepID=UPI00315D4DB8